MSASVLKTLFWSLSVALSISAIAYSTALYNVEDAKQNAFMMKACTDAGGDWLKAWSSGHYCQRAH